MGSVIRFANLAPHRHHLDGNAARMGLRQAGSGPAYGPVAILPASFSGVT